MNKMDRIKEWVATHRTTLIQVGAVISIAVLVSAIMINSIAASKAAFTAEVERLDSGITTVGSTVANLGSKIVTVEGRLQTTADGLTAVTETVTGATDSIAALDTRLDLAKDRIDALGTEVEAVKAAATNPLQAWLTGTAGNYTLHAKSSVAGNFTAIIHLGYESPVAASNGTYQDALDAFYGSVNATAANFKAYVPTVSYNGTDWHLTGVSFSAGLITLVAQTEKAIAVPFGGLHADYAPDWAYVEIWPALRES